MLLPKLAAGHRPTKLFSCYATACCDSLRPPVLSCVLAGAAGGRTPTMAAAVVKLIGPDMPTSGLHVSLETVA
eukprot:scaffold20186_cov69-Phaeocystis_antarctica.AAC.3